MLRQREHKEGMTEFFGKLDRERNQWDIAVIGPNGASALVRGKVGQAAEPVLDIAQRGLSIVREVTA